MELLLGGETACSDKGKGDPQSVRARAADQGAGGGGSAGYHHPGGISRNRGRVNCMNILVDGQLRKIKSITQMRGRESLSS